MQDVLTIIKSEEQMQLNCWNRSGTNHRAGNEEKFRLCYNQVFKKNIFAC